MEGVFSDISYMKYLAIICDEPNLNRSITAIQNQSLRRKMLTMSKLCGRRQKIVRCKNEKVKENSAREYEGI